MPAPAASTRISTRMHDTLSELPAAEWDALSNADNPFLKHGFLSGLEEYDCLDNHGWIPRHVSAWQGNRLVGAVPLYLRTDSYGEFVFDWAWADAYERAGGRYYPKLVSAIPFTPVCGPRILVHPECDAVEIRDRLADEVIQLTDRNGLSSFHCLFADPGSIQALQDKGLLLRKTVQFHWFNPGYRDFQDFLDTLTSKRRKQLRQERRRVEQAGIEIQRLGGDEVTDEQWQTFYEFYCATFHRRWGRPRLTPDFFRSLSRRLPRETLLILARRDSRYIAGAFAMLGESSVFGRHWGCLEDVPFLHFELCYHQTIEHCIATGRRKVDAGVQGEHKLNRGFRPVCTLSGHWLGHRGFRDAVSDYLEQESPRIDRYIEELTGHLPYK